MSNTEVIGLAQKAVSLPGWKWAPRTRTIEGWSVLSATLNLVTLWHPNCPYYTLPPGEVADRCGGVDLSDPATGGILQDMLKDEIYIEWFDTDLGEWYIELEPDLHLGRFCAPHLGAACVKAAVKLGRWPEAS